MCNLKNKTKILYVLPCHLSGVESFVFLVNKKTSQPKCKQTSGSQPSLILITLHYENEYLARLVATVYFI